MSVLPADWCPGLPPVERLARLILDQRTRGGWRYDLTDPTTVRAALARTCPGNLLQDVIDRRDAQLVEEAARVHTVLTFLCDAVGLTQAALEVDAALRAPVPVQGSPSMHLPGFAALRPNENASNGYREPA